MSIGCSVISWNCRGAKNLQFLRNAKGLIRRFILAIFPVIELRISELEAYVKCRRLGRSNWVRSDAEGFSGGLWVLWNRADISIRVVHVQKFLLHILIDEGKSSAWELTAIYASPKHHLMLVV